MSFIVSPAETIPSSKADRPISAALLLPLSSSNLDFIGPSAFRAFSSAYDERLELAFLTALPVLPRASSQP